MIPSFSNKFFVNQSKRKGDVYPIYIRIIIGRKKAEIATNFWLSLSEWDESKQRARRNAKINEELASIESEIYDIIKRLDKDGKPIEALSVKNILTKKEVMDVFLLAFFDSYIKRMKLNVSIKETSIIQYKTTQKHVTNFIKSKKLDDIRIDQIDYRFITDFDLFLMQQKAPGTKTPFERNTINKHQSRLRTILIRAIKEGHIQKNPFVDFKLKSVPSKRTFLTEEELKRLIEHKLNENESLIRVRDLFVFSAYTGLRFQDAQDLAISEIHISKENEYTIKLDQSKTGISVSIPLLKPAIDIVNNYDNEERLISGKVLPKISNQKVNAYLKVIADLAEIQKELTHHVARHTCATTILLTNGVPIEAVSKWLGHTNIKTTQIYAKITDQYLHQMAKQVDLKLESRVEKSSNS
jgi:site-specific recombinase XerD